MPADTQTETAAEESARLTASAESAAIPREALDGATHDYPADLNYWMIALVLGLFTAVEVSTYSFPDFWATVLVPTLLVLMALKFWIVTFFFMHLRFDKNFLTVLFYAGLGLAATVYLVMLGTFEFFRDEDPDPVGLIAKVVIMAVLVSFGVIVVHRLFRKRDKAKGTVH
jgi:cytochrome c oxidase subunit 4